MAMGTRMAERSVANARCSQWCCADNDNSSNNYLRGDSEENSSLRRLSLLDEFPEKTHPEGLNMADELTMNGNKITMEELFYFVREQYPTIIGIEKTEAIKALEERGVLQEMREANKEFDKNLILYGPPGTGKTLLASRLPSILPPLNMDENLEVASIYSVANTPHQYGQRPFRAPHHTASAIALVGGGSHPKPGEITLAHLGVLFLDELPEFDRKVLEVLRQPLESKEIVISRASRQITYPANFQLIAAMNPCPCGYAFNQDSRCQCSAESIKRYQNRISGPLLDRIDLHIDVPPLSAQDLQNSERSESSACVRQRVLQAHSFQLNRQGFNNQLLSPQQLEDYAVLSPDSQKMLAMAQQRLNLSARAYHRVLRVARTIADLAQSELITSVHLSEALSYRSPFQS